MVKETGEGEPRPAFADSSGRPLAPVYRPSDLDGFSYEHALADPAQYPFTRGIYPEMYRRRLWTMRQYSGYGDAEQTNRRFRWLLAQGQTGLSVAFDLPTQIGYDSDDPIAAGEVGKVGVAIDSLEDMERLLAGLPLEKVSVSMTINATASVLLAMYVAVARKRGIPLEKLSGTIQNDILKEYISRGTYIFPPDPSLRLVVDAIEFCRRRVPRWNPISISGYHIREAGATAAQEIGFTLADGICYVERTIRRGLSPDEFGPRLSFFFSSDAIFLEEVAKFRAARRMWAKIMRDRFGATRQEAMRLRFHVQTAGSSLTAQQPLNNIIRTTVEAMAAVFGGCQSLHTNSYDEALSLPTEKAALLALRTQQVLAYESGLAACADPLGGSYAVEHLTNRLEQEASRLLEEIDRIGGMVRAVETGWVQRQIQESAWRHQRQVEQGEKTLVGVNRFSMREENPPPVLRVSREAERRQIRRLARLRRRRDDKKVRAALGELREAARGRDNLMEPILKAVETYATVGEIGSVLRDVFGEHREVPCL